MFINGKIGIKINTDGKDQFIGTMYCNSCRSAIECNSAEKCKLFNYLNERIPGSTIDENNVITLKVQDFNKAFTLVKRAIRLRQHRIR